MCSSKVLPFQILQASDTGTYTPLTIVNYVFQVTNSWLRSWWKESHRYCWKLNLRIRKTIWESRSIFGHQVSVARNEKQNCIIGKLFSTKKYCFDTLMEKMRPVGLEMNRFEISKKRTKHWSLHSTVISVH